jgi:hypothetical protein
VSDSAAQPGSAARQRRPAVPLVGAARAHQMSAPSLAARPTAQLDRTADIAAWQRKFGCAARSHSSTAQLAALLGRIVRQSTARQRSSTFLLDRAAQPRSSKEQGSTEQSSTEQSSTEQLDRAELDRAELDRAELDRAELDRAELDRAELDIAELDRAARQSSSTAQHAQHSHSSIFAGGCVASSAGNPNACRD